MSVYYSPLLLDRIPIAFAKQEKSDKADDDEVSEKYWSENLFFRKIRRFRKSFRSIALSVQWHSQTTESVILYPKLCQFIFRSSGSQPDRVHRRADHTAGAKRRPGHPDHIGLGQHWQHDG